MTAKRVVKEGIIQICLVAGRQRLSISDLASNGVVAEACLLVHGILLQSRHATQEVLDGAEAVLGSLAASQAVKRQRRTVEDEPDVVGLDRHRREIRVLVENRDEVVEGCLIARACPHFRDEARAEGRDLTSVESPVRRSVVHVAWEAALGAVSEVVQSERGEHRNNDVVVRHVEVERLVQGELGRVVVVGDVDAGVAGGDQLGFEPGRQFENVSNALRAAAWGTISVIAIELQVNVVCEIEPLLLCE